MKRFLTCVLVLAILVSWAAMVDANGVNPPRTVVGVDVECTRADGTTVSVKNARVLGLVPEHRKVGFLKVRHDGGGSASEVPLDDIERLTIPAGAVPDDQGFVPGDVKAKGAKDESVRVQVKSPEGTVSLVGTTDVALLDCRELRMKARSSDSSETGRGVPAY